MINDYIALFVDKVYPKFIDKYLNTKTLTHLKQVTQFCGCDYTKLYTPLFLYTRFDHSLVVAHMTWHFTHNKKETIAALLHDIGTPCFAHCIDYVFGDYMNQESSEKKIIDIIKQDKELLSFLEEDTVTLNELENFDTYPILENKSPNLCTDRLDGVLHTCAIWLHTHSYSEIKKVYNDMVVLRNESNIKEIGFQSKQIAELFTSMVLVYAKELQGNKDKYVMKYISEIVKLAFTKNVITLEDLYTKSENEIVTIFSKHFISWSYFKEATNVIGTAQKPNQFYICFETKKRNTIPLVNTSSGSKRIVSIF